MFLPPATRRTDAGVTIVECLAALVLLAVGVLGAVGTVGSAWRVMRAGDRAALAARRLLSLADSIGASGDCARMTSAASREGVTDYAWTVTAVTGGSEVKLTATYPGLDGQHTDSALTRLRCTP